MNPIKSAGYAAVTLAMYVGLPLLGWGFGDIRGFFSSPARTAYAGLVLCLGLVAGYVSLRSPKGIRGGRGVESKRVSRQTVVARAMTLLLFVGLVLIPFFDRRAILTFSITEAGRWFGFVLGAGGLLIIFWSGIVLGRQYSPEVTIQEAHKLITSGPYRAIRHPRYVGGILTGIGFSGLFCSWAAFILTAIFGGVVLFRIADKERMMAREFGAEWTDYCARSWRLVPYIY